MAFVGSANTAAGGSPTLSLSVPGGLAAGQYALVWWCFDVGGHSPTPPSGWVLLSSASGTDQTYLCYRKASTTGSEGSETWNIGASGNNAEAIFACWSGRETGGSQETFATLTGPNNAANASPVSIAANSGTAAAGDDIAIFAGTDCSVNVADRAGSISSPYTERADAQNGWAWSYLATQDAVTAGALGTITVTATGSGTCGWAAFVVAIKVPGPSVPTVAPITSAVMSRF
jgi:hypothetical protein